MPYLDLNNVSIGNGALTITELKIPLWNSNAGAAGTTVTNAYQLIQKGSLSSNAASSPISANTLHTLNSNWNPNQKFVFEFTANNSGSGGYYTLWDLTAGAPVTASQAMVSGIQVFRTPTFTLIPGHKYGVGLYSLSSSFAARICRPYLVAVLS